MTDVKDTFVQDYAVYAYAFARTKQEGLTYAEFSTKAAFSSDGKTTKATKWTFSFSLPDDATLKSAYSATDIANYKAALAFPAKEYVLPQISNEALALVTPQEGSIFINSSTSIPTVYLNGKYWWLTSSPMK